MIEKRRSPRAPIHLTLSICDLYKQDVSGIHNLDTPIDLVDISVHGLGFTSECILPLNYYFNASFTAEPDLTFTATLRILRCDVLDADHYFYGGEFVDLEESAHQAICNYASLISTR